MVEEKEHQRARNERLQRILNGKRIKSKNRQERNGGEIAGWVKIVDGRKNIREEYRKKVDEWKRLEEAETNILAEDAQRRTLKMRLKTRGFGERVCGFWEN